MEQPQSRIKKHRNFTLKHNESFAVVDAAGNCTARNEHDGEIADGIIRNDTRILSRHVLRIGDHAPDVISADVDDDNTCFEARLENPALPGLPAGALAIRRRKVLWDGNIYEQLDITNTTDTPVTAPVEITFEADFRDIFELRGAKRTKRGTTNTPQYPGASEVTFSYDGLDGKKRDCGLSFSEPPAVLDDTHAEFRLDIAPGTTKTLVTRMGSGNTATLPATADGFKQARAHMRDFVQRHTSRAPRITTSNAEFDRWMQQNAADLAQLTTELDTGPYPTAGLPWFSTPFGRDGTITALEMLWQDPEMARGVLAFQAVTQATQTDTFRDSEPGKIFHETRAGEMANLGEVPYGPYYGTIDATPLFVMLAGAYYERTGDLAFIRSIWPQIENALEWIDTHGDRDGDGFVEYQCGEDTGLGNQCWKDSEDSISHADGRLADAPIAMSEVQGYVYAARKAAASLASTMGDDSRADDLARQADDIKRRFNRVFWSNKLGTYAMALDGNKKRCEVNASNNGHVLYSGIVPKTRAGKVTARLMDKDMFCGWGIRTLGSNEKRYEPVKVPEGYHNGTVWTHDTAIAAAGMARNGHTKEALDCLTGLFEASKHFNRHRLPELFGGTARKNPGDTPDPYPVACNPQAWAAGAGSMLLQAALGLEIDAPNNTIRVTNPTLPDWLDHVEISGLDVNGNKVSLDFRKGRGGVDVTLPHNPGGVRLARTGTRGNGNARATERKKMQNPH